MLTCPSIDYDMSNNFHDAKTINYQSQINWDIDSKLSRWLSESMVLESILGNLPYPNSVVNLESFIKDGTLLCLICTKILFIPIRNGWFPKPRSLKQCISNILKAIDALRNSSKLDSKFLFSGVENDIFRGNWSVIFGLLSDICRLSKFEINDIEKTNLHPDGNLANAEKIGNQMTIENAIIDILPSKTKSSSTVEIYPILNEINNNSEQPPNWVFSTFEPKKSSDFDNFVDETAKNMSLSKALSIDDETSDDEYSDLGIGGDYKNGKYYFLLFQ
jgi:hypothetical protein